MSPGRASSALTIRRPLLPCSALRTHVATAAQPLPGISYPASPSAQVGNEAHHGLPGGNPAAARYSSTCGPVFAPAVSRTPRWVCAIRSAAAPSELPPEPVAAAGAARPRAATAGTAAAAPGRGGGAAGGEVGRGGRSPPESSVLKPTWTWFMCAASVK